MKDSPTWITTEALYCSVIFDTSVSHHQYCLFVWALKCKVNRCHFQRFHSAEMRSKKPWHPLLNPNSWQNPCHANFKPTIMSSKHTAACSSHKLVAIYLLPLVFFERVLLVIKEPTFWILCEWCFCFSKISIFVILLCSWQFLSAFPVFGV